MNRTDFRQAFTEQVAQSLELGQLPWRKAWQQVQRPPCNAVTDRPYRGGNALLLGLAGEDDRRWCTYRQAQAAGWQVRRGARAVHLEYYHYEPAPDGNAEDPTSETGRLVRRGFQVFAARDIDGIPPLETPAPAWAPEEQAELLLIGCGVEIRHGGDRAAYVTRRDAPEQPGYIQMPPRHAFPASADYYATVFHELAHWDGHVQSRAAMPDATDLVAYAREEIVAELSSVFLHQQLGLATGRILHEDSLPYLQGFAKALRADRHLLFQAASEASSRCERLLAYGPDQGVDQDMTLGQALDGLLPPLPLMRMA